jgi:hypothetical protein
MFLKRSQGDAGNPIQKIISTTDNTEVTDKTKQAIHSYVFICVIGVICG